jgi:hypothetical protein
VLHDGASGEAAQEGGGGPAKLRGAWRERETAGIAAATATGLARAPVGRDVWDEDEQGDGTAMNLDVGSGKGFGDIGLGQDGLSSTTNRISKIISKFIFSE